MSSGGSERGLAQSKVFDDVTSLSGIRKRKLGSRSGRTVCKDTTIPVQLQ
jgi:hypothetical protein